MSTFNLEAAKEFLFDELGFKHNRQSKYHERELMNASNIYMVLENHYLKSEEKAYLKMIELIKEHKELILKND